jgi:hypothetical protein
LLIPAGSKLLELPDLAAQVGAFDPAALGHPWKHTDPRGCPAAASAGRGHRAEHRGETRSRIFDTSWTLTHTAAGRPAHPVSAPLLARAAIPYLNEPWYC